MILLTKTFILMIKSNLLLETDR